MRRKLIWLAIVGLLLPVASAWGQIRQEPNMLKRMWPLGRKWHPAPQWTDADVLAASRRGRWPLIAPPVARGKVDINNCRLEDLQNLPGVDAAMGSHIMAGRPYRDYDDLSRDGVPLNVVERLRGQITFGPGGAR